MSFARHWYTACRSMWGRFRCERPAGHKGIHTTRELWLTRAKGQRSSFLDEIIALRDEMLKLANDNEAKHYEGPAYVSQAQRGFVERLDGIIARAKDGTSKAE